MKKYLKICILLGLVFVGFQFFEYYIIFFKFRDSVFSSIFFIGTGFHGFHVCLGLFILLTLLIIFSLNLSNLKNSLFDMLA
jgi:cytochrome c oxidase subunit III